MAFVPQGLFSASNPLALRQAARQRYVGQAQRAAPIAAPKGPIYTKNPWADFGAGLGALGKSLGQIGAMRKESAASDALAGMYNTPAELAVLPPDQLPAPGMLKPQPTANQMYRLAAQHAGTKAGAAAMQNADRLQTQANALVDRQFKSQENALTRQGHLDVADVRAQAGAAKVTAARRTAAQTVAAAGLPALANKVFTGAFDPKLALEIAGSPGRAKSMQQAQQEPDQIKRAALTQQAMTPAPTGGGVEGMDIRTLEAAFDNPSLAATPQYRAAYTRLAASKPIYDAARQRYVMVAPNMTAYPTPPPRAAGAPRQAVATGAQPPQAPTPNSVQALLNKYQPNPQTPPQVRPQGQPQARTQAPPQAPAPGAPIPENVLARFAKNGGEPAPEDFGSLLQKPNNAGTQKLGVEALAKIGLATTWFKNLPKLRKLINDGGLDGIGGLTGSMLSIGTPGEVTRMMKTGADAITRLLTGAGMVQQEVADQAKAYLYRPLIDGKKDVLLKIDELEDQLAGILWIAQNGGVPKGLDPEQTVTFMEEKGAWKVRGKEAAATSNETMINALPPGAKLLGTPTNVPERSTGTTPAPKVAPTTSSGGAALKPLPPPQHVRQSPIHAAPKPPPAVSPAQLRAMTQTQIRSWIKNNDLKSLTPQQTKAVTDVIGRGLLSAPPGPTRLGRLKPIY